VASPLVAPAPFPAPAAFPAASPVPTFGLPNSDVGLVTSPPQAVAPSSALATLAQHQRQLATTSFMTGGAIGPDNDPANWTPEEAAAQTDRALARIAQVNPELAQTLMAQRTGEAPETDKGFLADIWDGITGAVGATVGGVLDILDRASHIVPEVILDDDDSVWQNVGDALSGESDARWRDVLTEKLGFNDTGIVTATLGFVLDVATDPLTYATFGMGGVGRAAASRAVSERALVGFLKGGDEAGSIVLNDVMTHAGGAVDDLVRGGITKEEAVAKLLFQETSVGAKMSEKAASSWVARAKSTLGGVHPDAAGHVLGASFQLTESAALRQALQVSDDAWRLASTVGWSRVTAETAAEFGIDKRAMDAAFRQTVRAGSGFGVDRAAYEAGKRAAAAMGGIRFRLPMPILGFRLQTNKLIPFSQYADFQPFRKFFTGLSGGTRLSHMVGNKTATVEDLRAFWEGGFKGTRKAPGLAEFNPDLARELARGSKLHMGSVFYPLSEVMGGMTANMSPTAKMLRGGGWGMKVAGDARKVSAHIKEQTEEGIRMLARQDGTPITSRQADKLVVEGYGVPKQRRGDVDVAQPEKAAEFDEFIRTRHPEQEWFESADDFYKPRIQAATNAGDFTFAATLQASLDLARQAEAPVRARGEKFLEATKVLHGQVRQAYDQRRRVAADPDMVDTALTQADELRPEDAARLREGSHPLVRDNPVYMDDESVLRDDHLGPEILTDTSKDGRSIVRGAHFYQPKLPIDPETGKPVVYSGEFIEFEQAEELMKLRDEVMPEEYDELVRDVTGGAGAGMFSDLVEENSVGAKLLTKLQGAEGKSVSFDQLTEGLAHEERRAVRDNLNRLREDKGGIKTAAAARGRQEYAAQLRNPYVRYETTSGPTEGATGITDQLKEARDAFKTTLDEIEERTGQKLDDAVLQTEGLADELKAIVNGELNKTKALSEWTEKWLRDRGYDGLIEHYDDGIHTTVLRADDGYIPVARINPNAPHAGSASVLPPRIASRAATQAVHSMPSIRELPGGSERWLRQRIRATANMPLDRAEAQLRVDLEKIGVQLRPNQKVLDTDSYKTVRFTATDAAEAVRAKYLGDAGRTLESLGYTDSVWRGGAAGTPRFRYVVNEGAFEELDRFIDGKVRKADERAAEFMAGPGVDTLRQSLRSKTNQLKEYVENLSSRGTTITTMMRLGRVTDEIFDASQVNAALADAQSRFRRLADETPETFTKLSDNIYRNVAPDQTHYYWVENERVLSVRAVHEVEEGKSQIQRGATAMTAKEASGKGLAKKLHEQHWADMGIDDLDKAAEAVAAQTFSKAGLKLNESRIKAMVKKLQDDATAAANEEMDKIRGAITEGELATSEIRRIKTRMTTKAAKVQPAIVAAENARNMTGMEFIRIQGMEEFAMPTFMAQEFRAAAEGFKSFTGFHKQWRQFNSWWKSMATWLWPSFHVRNAMGSYFNNWLGGVGFKDYVATRRIRMAAWETVHKPPEQWKWARAKIKDVDPDLIAGLRRAGTRNVGGVQLNDMTYADLAELEVGLGLTAGNSRTFAEPELAAERVEALRGQRPLERYPFLRQYFKGARGAGTMTENVFRTAAFVRGIKNHGDIMEARAFTMMRHGDYSDLTDFEYGTIRDLIPFYKWTRTNFPFQLHQLFESPGKLLAVKKAQEAAFTAAGMDYREEKYKMPDWMQNQTIVPFKGEGDAFTSVMLDLPMSDLYMNGREFLSSFLPLARPFIESYGFGKSLFTGAPLEGKPVALPGPLKPLGGFLQAVGLANKGEDGTVYTDDKTVNVLGVIPIFSRTRNWLYADPERVKLRTETLISTVFGVTPRTVDDERLADTELDFYYSQVLPMMEHLKDMGYPLPTTDDLAAAGQTADTVLTGLGITPSVALVS
jgi:hypothetical protein